MFNKINEINIVVYNTGSYLNNNEILLLLLLSKNTNFINKEIIYKIINDRKIYASNVIKNFMKCYKIFININKYLVEHRNIITKKTCAVQYFRNYPKKFINSWYNINYFHKKDIIDKYKTKYTDTPSRLDLYLLIKKIPVDDVSYIGW